MNSSFAGRGSKIAWIWVSSWSFGTGWPLMAYPPSSASSSTIWLLACWVTVVFSGGGTCTSMAIRDSGCVIMKMISSTSRMSIIGTTFGSAETCPRSPPPPPAMLLLLLVLVFGTEDTGGRLGRLGDGGHHPDAGAPGGLHRVLDFAVLELVVRLEVEDLVLRPRGVDRAELVLQGALRQRPPVEEVPPEHVDPQNHFVVALRPGVEVLALGQGGLEPRGDQRRHDHEDDQQHEHDVDHRHHVRRGADGCLPRSPD